MQNDYGEQAEIDRIATNFVEQVLIAHGWEMFQIKPDYRIDYDIEPRKVKDAEEPKKKSLTGHRLSVQQKGKKHVRVSGKGATCGDLEVDHVCYWVDLYQRPVFLFVIDIATKKGWWLFIQQYIIENSAVLGKVKGKWRNQKTMTVHVPLSQTLDSFKALEDAIAESYRYMAKLHPMSINDSIEAQIAKLKALDPDVQVSVQATSENKVFFILNATNPQRLFGIYVNPTGKRSARLHDDIIEKGLLVTHEPGEINFVGSAIFETDWFRQMRGIQIARSSQNDVYLSIAATDEHATVELKFPNVNFVAGRSELRLDGQLWEELCTLKGVIAEDATIQQMSFRIDLSKWMGHRVSELRYFKQLFAFTKAALQGRNLSIYVELLDERHLIGTARAMKDGSRQQWESLAAAIQFIDNLRIVETRLGATFCVPKVFDRNDFDLVDKILSVTDYRSFSAPEWTARTELKHVPEASLIQMQSGNLLPGMTVLKKAATEIQLLGQTIIVPGHSYTTTHVVPRLVEVTGPHSMIIDWTGTGETVVTLAPDHGELPLEA